MDFYMKNSKKYGEKEEKSGSLTTAQKGKLAT